MVKNNIKIVFLLGMLACLGMQQGQAKSAPVSAAKKTRQIVTAGYLKQRTHAQEYLKIVQEYNKQQLVALQSVLKSMQDAKQAGRYSDLSKIFSAYEKTSDKKLATYSDTKEVLREKMEKDGASQEFLRELELLEVKLLPSQDKENNNLKKDKGQVAGSPVSGRSLVIGDARQVIQQSALEVVLADAPADLPEKYIAQFVTQLATDLDAYNQLFKKYKLFV